ncbi:MAG: hypothetical protein ACD_3C00183G0009 [uncultured bacterium (gcode 4)]|uniref:Uncharacterized protein n=1 Tax=uncultured bacterium (gcode 4) TaxID=1234023 RepID=K2F993_9BACT|nr:MAG: hypothetical protein ACD_3C00183G0009 [uncultured bacterium (gcode 4)]
MNNNDFEKLIDIHVPNYRRFQDALDPESDIIVDLAIMLKKVYDAWILESVGKYINLELWMCVLKDKEIDQAKVKEMISTFKK